MPIVLPRRSARLCTFGSIDMNEFSGTGTTAATVVTGSFCAAAKKTSCSYETARSVRPTPTSFSGVVASEGAWIATSSPALSNIPVSRA